MVHPAIAMMVVAVLVVVVGGARRRLRRVVRRRPAVGLLVVVVVTGKIVVAHLRIVRKLPQLGPSAGFPHGFEHLLLIGPAGCRHLL